jgi:hypothetical protein
LILWGRPFSLRAGFQPAPHDLARKRPSSCLALFGWEINPIKMFGFQKTK